MQHPHPAEEQNGASESGPQPWERQSGEPLDRYRWFQIYLCIPPPRTFKRVNQVIGVKPGSRLVSRAASHWRWKERVAASDDPHTGALALISEWRDLLLREIAYVTRFIALEDTTRALENAAIDQMDRAGARKHLGALLQHQRGLYRLIPPPPKNGNEENDAEEEEEWMKDRIEDRAREIKWQWDLEVIERVYGKSDPDDATEPDNGGPQQPLAPDSAATQPWHQQPGEPANRYFQFQLYLSLMFLQSTDQVARMARIGRKTTLDKVARKWRWQQRAVAFDSEHAAKPFARAGLQERLLSDRAYNAHLHGQLETARALETAQLGQLDRLRARNAFPRLSRHLRSLLQPAMRQKTTDKKTLVERRRALLAPHIEKLALPRAHELDYAWCEKLVELGFGEMPE